MANHIAGSFNARLRGLALGQTATQSKRFPIGEDQDIQGAMETLRRTVNATVSRMRTKTGSEFRVESGSFVTSDNTAVIINACVTCLSGGAETSDNDEDDGDI